MAKNENKILDELRRRGKIYEDPAPKVGGENGAFPPTRDGCIHSLSMRERG